MAENPMTEWLRYNILFPTTVQRGHGLLWSLVKLLIFL